jgi:hypothetical protein
VPQLEQKRAPGAFWLWQLAHTSGAGVWRAPHCEQKSRAATLPPHELQCERSRPRRRRRARA